MKLIRELLDHEIIMATYHEHYQSLAPGTISATQAAIKKVHAGAKCLGWVRGPCPIENDLREQMGIHYRPPRYGYHPRDAIRIVEYLVAHGSHCALAAKIALYCGLRISEIAGLAGENLDRESRKLHFSGKNGRYREVPIPKDLLDELIRKSGYFFTPSRS
ncbi:MAG: tyrosine-type recombinase/integrase [Anaerolineales bacterium]|nr:tyrosine-type recombinase/integrase [Anaerolineales bacterium]